MAATPAAVVVVVATFEKRRPVVVTLHGERRPRPTGRTADVLFGPPTFPMTGRMCPRADHTAAFHRGAAFNGESP